MKAVRARRLKEPRDQKASAIEAIEDGFAPDLADLEAAIEDGGHRG
jgi:hypothetical protein